MPTFIGLPYVNEYKNQQFGDHFAWAIKYPGEEQLWQFVNEQTPTDTTVAYANTSLVYPLQGFSLDRRVVYAPTRRGVRTPADLPRLGERLSGEQVVLSAIAATRADADLAWWEQNLQSSGAKYLLIEKSLPGELAPEPGFVTADPKPFRKLFEKNDRGVIYAIVWPEP